MNKKGVLETIFSIFVIILAFVLFSFFSSFFSKAHAGVINVAVEDVEGNMLLLNLLRSNVSTSENVADLLVESIEKNDYDAFKKVVYSRLASTNYTWELTLQDEQGKDLKTFYRTDWIFDYGSSTHHGEAKIPTRKLDHFYYILLTLQKGHPGGIEPLAYQFPA